MNTFWIQLNNFSNEWTFDVLFKYRWLSENLLTCMRFSISCHMRIIVLMRFALFVWNLTSDWAQIKFDRNSISRILMNLRTEIYEIENSVNEKIQMSKVKKNRHFQTRLIQFLMIEKGTLAKSLVTLDTNKLSFIIFQNFLAS